MMNTLGVIVEYNPLHDGHINHLRLSKKITGCKNIVAVMSGNFVQRGEPAICDKWRRTKMALDAGVDLVVELPVSYAVSSAGYFAKGACGLLDKMGLIDCLCFGSECDDITVLTEYAKLIWDKENSCEFKARLQVGLRSGLSYPAARANALEVALPDAPNNVLGVEYIKALIELGSGILPYTVPRYANVSAKELRADLSIARGSMPVFSWEILSESLNLYGAAKLDNLSVILHYILKTGNLTGDLANRLARCAEGSRLISEILKEVKTKRYTYTHLQRAVLRIILGVQDMPELQYIRVLGFRKESSHLLKQLEECATLPIILNKKPPELNREINATAIYSLAFANHVNFNEHTLPLVIK